MENSPGPILRKAREDKKLTIAQAAKGTRLRPIYIHGLESDDYSILPSPVQLRGFLRLYAEFLELNADELLSSLPPEYLSEKKEAPIDTAPAEIESEYFKVEEPNTKKQPNILDALRSRKKLPPEIVEEKSKPAEDKSSEHFEKEEFPTSVKANEIFSEIGTMLKNRRELLGISIKEVESNTHVLKRYLESIEAGRFDSLETTVQTKGMLSNYAHFL
ncbi:MAG: helix-turn-helix domain-containing protein, partial [Anaerolineales bacterium]